MTVEELNKVKKATSLLTTMLSGICQEIGIDEETEMRVKSGDETLLVVSIKEVLELGEEATSLLKEYSLC